MATEIKLRRGTTAQHASFNGAEGEVTFDTDLHTLIVHNNAGNGTGERLAKYSELGSALTVEDAGSDTTMFPLLSTDATGAINPKTDTSSLTYNAATGALSSTSFVGALSGNVTGTIQTAAQTNITSLGTLTALNVAGAIANTGSLTNTGDVTIISTSTSDADVPLLTLERAVDDSTGNAFHDLGSIIAKGVDLANTDNRHTYAEIDFNAATDTAGSEAGRITFKISISGASPEQMASVRTDGFFIEKKGVFSKDGATNAHTSLVPTFNTNSTNINVNLPSSAGTLALENTIVAHTQSTDGTVIDHATVAGYVGKTVVYTNTGDGDDLTLGLPDVGVDIAIGQQIHLVNASNGSGSSALIILDLSESGTGQTVNICTGATVLSNTGSADPHIVAGGVATLVATADNTYALFGSGVVDN